MNSQPKPVFVPVTDPATIDAIKRSSLSDPIGGEHGGRWYAYAWSLERYRSTAGKEGGR